MRWNNFLPFCCFDLLIYFAVVLRVACTIISCFWWIKLWAVLLYFVCWFYVVHLFQNVDGDEWWPAYLRMNMIASVQSNSDLLQVFSKKKKKKKSDLRVNSRALCSDSELSRPGLGCLLLDPGCSPGWAVDRLSSGPLLLSRSTMGWRPAPSSFFYFFFIFCNFIILSFHNNLFANFKFRKY